MPTVKEEENIKKYLESIGSGITGYLIFVILWMIIGFIAFIWSLVCFGKSGSIWEKIIGFVLSIIVGPFYFLYFALNKGYCR